MRVASADGRLALAWRESILSAPTPGAVAGVWWRQLVHSRKQPGIGEAARTRVGAGDEGPVDPDWPVCTVAGCAAPATAESVALGAAPCCWEHEADTLSPDFAFGDCDLACGRAAKERCEAVPGVPALCSVCAEATYRRYPVNHCVPPNAAIQTSSDAQPCSGGAGCGIDAVTAEAERWRDAIRRTAAEEREQRVVARLDCPYDPAEVELCRELSPGLAAQLIEKLAPQLSSRSPKTAELIAAASKRAAIAAQQAPHVPEVITNDFLMRVERDSERSLKALQLVIDNISVAGPDHRNERAVVIVNALLNAARMILPRSAPAPRPPCAADQAAWRALSAEERVIAHARGARGDETSNADLSRRCIGWRETAYNGWMPRTYSGEEISHSEAAALVAARRGAAAVTNELLPDRPLLDLLRKLSPSARGDWQHAERYAKAGLKIPKKLSEAELIKLYSPLLRRLGLWPNVRGRANSVEAEARAIEQLRKMVPPARRAREEALGIRQSPGRTEPAIRPRHSNLAKRPRLTRRAVEK